MATRETDATFYFCALNQQDRLFKSGAAAGLALTMVLNRLIARGAGSNRWKR
jgi:hypothetical protein